MPARSGECIFCGNRLSIRAKEHIFAQWLQDDLKIKKRKFVNMLNKNIGNRRLLPSGVEALYESEVNRNHTFSGLLNGRVCKPCNNKWMSGLEVAVAPDLIGLMSGKLLLASLSDQSRLTLAKWTSKTAYMLYFAFSDFNYVPNAHPRFFKSHGLELPADVVVYGKQLSTRSITDHYISSNRWISSSKCNTGSSEKILQPRGSSYKISFQLGQLHLMLAHYSDPVFRMVPRHGDHILVYPLGEAPIAYVNPLPRAFLRSLPHLGEPNEHQLFHLSLVASDLTPGDLQPGTRLVNLILLEGS